MATQIIIKHSSGSTLPTLVYGELGLNFKKGTEALYAKNNNNEIFAINEWGKILNKPTTLSGFGISASDTLFDLKYLNLSGGTLSGVLYTNSSILFNNNTLDLSWGGFTNGKATINGNGGLNIYPLGHLSSGDVTINSHKVWHAGNDGAGSGLDAGKLAGTEPFFIFKPFVMGGNSNINFNTYQFQIGTTFWSGGNGTGNANTPFDYGQVVELGNRSGNYGHSLMIAAESDNTLYYRNCYLYNGAGGGFGPWKTFAFTDSNVASATKLANTRKIWGQSFNGENDITGDLKIGYANAFGISYSPSDTNIYNYFYGGSVFNLKVGEWTASNVNVFNIETHNGGTAKRALSVMNNGFVGINTNGPAYELDVNGSGRFIYNLSVEANISCKGWIYSNLSGGGLYNTVFAAGIVFDTNNIVRTYGTNKFNVFNTESDSISTLGGIKLWNGTKSVTLTVDSNGNLKVDGNLYATGEVSAYGSGTGSTGGGGGTSYNRLDSWSDYGLDKAGYVLSAYLGNDLNSRLSAIEGNGATSIVVNGSGNAITNVSKAGTTLTFVKSLNFAEVGHTHSYIPLASNIYMGSKDLYFNAADSGDIVFSDSALNQTGRIWHDGISLKISGTNSTSANLLSIGGSIFKYNNNTIWHAGNDGAGSGLDADLLDGLHGGEYLRKYPPGATSTFDLNNSTGVNILSGYNVTNSPYSGDVGMLLIPLWVGGGKYSAQLVVGLNPTINPYFRVTNSEGSGTWKQLAFLDSNVASATKLANTRTIWGQNFNGEGNVDGLLYINNNTSDGGITIKNTSDTYSRIRFFDSTENPATIHAFSGYPFLYNNQKCLNLDVISSGAISFGSWNNPIMYINKSNGNVGIGTTADSGYKLDVNGTGRFSGSVIVDGPIYTGFHIESTDGGLGISKRADNSLGFYSANNIGLTLKKNGNVIISANETDYGYKLDVNGTFRAVGATYLNSTLSVAGTSTLTGLLTANGGIGSTTGTFSSYVTANRFYTGYDANIYNSISCSNWFRSNGSSGWYNATYLGGIQMDTTNIVRTYSTNKFKVHNTEVDSVSTLGGIKLWNGSNSVTLSVDTSGNLKIDGNIYATGEVAAFSTGVSTLPITNADTLDGLHASSFIDTSATAQTKSGALTIGGALTCSGNVISTYYLLNNTSTNPYLKLIQGSTYYVQAYTGNLYLGSTVANSLAINSLGDVTVNGNAFNMLNLRRVNTNGSSILFSNPSNNLGKLGFNSFGSFMVGTGGSADGTPNLMNITSGSVVTFYGNISTSGSGTFTGGGFNSLRDLKIIHDDWGGNSISVINKFKIRDFNYKTQLDLNRTLGFIIDEIPSEVSDYILMGENRDSVNLYSLHALSFKAHQETKSEIDLLKEKIKELNNRIKMLENGLE